MEHDSSDHTPTFRALSDATADDFAYMGALLGRYKEELPERVLQHFDLLRFGDFGAPVNRYVHSLQTATRAERANRSDEYVLCALLHDIGDTLAPRNHEEIAAAMLRPFVPDDLHWMVAHHAIFQGYYFFEYVGRDPDERERFRDHHMFDATEEFVSEFDNPSFDPAYPTKPLSHFAPLVHDLMAKARSGGDALR